MTIENYFTQVDLALKDNDFLKAKGLLFQIIKIENQEKRAYILLCQILLRVNHLEELKKIIDQSIAIFPNVAEFWFYLGKLMLLQKNKNVAIRSFIKARELLQGKQPLIILISNELLTLGQAQIVSDFLPQEDAADKYQIRLVRAKVLAALGAQIKARTVLLSAAEQLNLTVADRYHIWQASIHIQAPDLELKCFIDFISLKGATIEDKLILTDLYIKNRQLAEATETITTLLSCVADLSPVQILNVFQRLIDSELYEKAKFLIIKDSQSKGLLPYHKMCQAIIELRIGSLKKALNVFNAPECEHAPNSIYFYNELQKYYFKRNQGDRFFAHESEFISDYFLLSYIDNYISCGELGHLITKTESFKNDDHIYVFRVESERILAFYLLGDFKNCQKSLNKSVVTSPSLLELKALKIPLIFNKFISSLISHIQGHKSLVCCDKTEKLYVIGESHCLTLSNKVFICNGVKYKATSNFIKGLQMHHLNDEVHNEHKYYLNKHIEKIPNKACLFFTIGEIDCRMNSGISRAATKLGYSIDEVINKTVTNYINFLANTLQNKNVKVVFIQGIPAPFIKKLLIVNDDTHIELIRKVNIKLRELTLANNWIFIDVYGATKDLSGWSHGNWHIDPIHLKPSLYDEISEWTITNNYILTNNNKN